MGTLVYIEHLYFSVMVLLLYSVLYNTTNPGMDIPLSSGQTYVQNGQTSVQTKGKYSGFLRKKTCQKLKN